MTPEQKAKLIKALVAALVAGLLAFVTTFSSQIKDIFTLLGSGTAIGIAVGLIARVI